MGQHDYEITAEDAASGKLFRAAVNAALQALASNNLGVAAPPTPYAGMWWADLEKDLMCVRNVSNTAWIIVGTISAGLFPVSHKYAQDGGTADAYNITVIPALTTHAEGMPIVFKAAHTNTGAATLAVGGLAIKAIRKNGTSALEANDIVAGQIVTVVYDGVYYQLQTPSAYIPGILAKLNAMSVPVKAVIPFPSADPPDGWLECNGAAISRTAYAALYAAIGVMYGNGDGSTTFNIPDYRGYFLRGWAHGVLTDPDKSARTNRGDGTVGDYVGTKQADALKEHSHNLQHYIMNGGGVGVPADCNSGGAANVATTTVTGGSETRPANINVMLCIKY